LATHLSAADGGVEGEDDGDGDGETDAELDGDGEVQATTNVFSHFPPTATSKIGAATGDSSGLALGAGGGVITFAGFLTI